MKKHKFAMTDMAGRTGWFSEQSVWFDTQTAVLFVGRTKIPLREITAVEIRPLPRGRGDFLAIDVCGPSINQYMPTTIRLIKKNFFDVGKIAPMKAFLDELQPLIQNNVPLIPPVAEQVMPAGLLQAQYALNVSLLLGFIRKLWYSYDKRGMIITKTLLLMLLGGVVNVAGVLLLVVPFDNFKMQRNLQLVGWPKWLAIMAYVLTSSYGYVFWILVFLRAHF